jgi:hypothetical protein
MKHVSKNISLIKLGLEQYFWINYQCTYMYLKAFWERKLHPRTQGLFGKDPGIGWSRDSTKINCPRGSGKVSNYMLPQKTLNFKYQEWDFTIYSSNFEAPANFYFIPLFAFKLQKHCSFYQQSSQETNKMYTLNFEVGYSQSWNMFSYQTGRS